MADLEYMYGKEKPAVEESYCECASVSLVMRYQSMTVNLTFVHPFMLDVMTICGANRAAPGLSFHFSSSGRNAKVSQYGPTALVLKLWSKASSEIASK